MGKKQTKKETEQTEEQAGKIRQPLIVVMGHIDHGKTSLLDSIRKTAVAKSEPGKITQMISSSMISIEAVKKLCAHLLEGKKVSIPGLLFIDTPGHAAFNNMRKLGGNLADIAVLVIDINEGVKPQTAECIELLKQYKTPFVIALNKVDLVPGFDASKPVSGQSEDVQHILDTKLYSIVGKLYEFGFNGERYDRVEDYTRQIPILPCSAKTGFGVPELLAVLIGLSQRYINLLIWEDKPGAGMILEVKEEKGLGTVLDIIIYEGKLKVKDKIVIGGISGAIETRVKGILLKEDNKTKKINEISAAAGIRLLVAESENILAGMPLLVANKNAKEAKIKVEQEVSSVLIETGQEGIVVKADTLGSLEALTTLLKNRGIKIKRASLGNITRKDIADAIAETEMLNRIILGFNVICLEENAQAKVLLNDVIYKLIEDFELWKQEEQKKLEQKELENVTRPAKFLFLKGCLFRQSNPCVIGVEVLQGKLRSDVDIIKSDGSNAGHIKSMESERKPVQEAEKGKQVAIALPGITEGRQIKEGDIFYVNLGEEEFRQLKKLKKYISNEEVELLKDFAELKRKDNALWGV
ncbi:translation initiation factor IF-2 [archaeon]|nr:translation initiation factor IF-2 [archaeon]